MRATEDTPPFGAVGLLLAGAARALLASRRVLPGEHSSRESLTQDSRSAVKARLFDPLRGSFGDGHCARRGTRRGGLEGGRHVGWSPPSRDETLRRRREVATARVRHWRLAPPATPRPAHPVPTRSATPPHPR